MDTDISKILKKGLTGKEAGKLVIGDKAKLNSLLSQKEIKTITDSLIDREQIAIYNSYFDLRNSASRCFTIFNMMSETVLKKVYLFRSVLKGSEVLKELTEIDGTFRKYLPCIMTEKEYSDKLELQKKEKFKITVGLDYLILQLVEHNIYKHQDFEGTPYSELFKQYEGQELTDPEVLASYKKTEDKLKTQKEEWELADYFTREMPYCVYNADTDSDKDGEEKLKQQLENKAEDFKKKDSEPRKYDRTDLLWDILSFYYSEENGVNIVKFKADYPELFNAVLKDIKALGLPIKENLDTLPLDKYSEVVLTYKDLYKVKLEPYVREIDYLDNIDGQEIAITKSSDIGTNEQGHYTQAQPLYMLKSILDDMFRESKVFRDMNKLDLSTGFSTFGVLETELKQALASYSLVKLCNEQAEIELIPNDMIDKKLWELRTTILQLNKDMMFYFEDLSNAEKNGYKPIYPDKLMPSKEKISKVKRKIKDAVSLKEYGIMKLVDELL